MQMSRQRQAQAQQENEIKMDIFYSSLDTGQE